MAPKHLIKDKQLKPSTNKKLCSTPENSNPFHNQNISPFRHVIPQHRRTFLGLGEFRVAPPEALQLLLMIHLRGLRGLTCTTMEG